MLYNNENKPLDVYALIRGVRYAVKCDSSLTWTKDYQISEAITINVIAPGINTVMAFDRFKLYIQGEKVFEGFVSSVNSASWVGSYEFNIEVSAWQSRFNYLYINKKYTNKSITQIFYDLYNNFMIDEEIKLGNIVINYDTFIESIDFGTETTLYQALDKLAGFGAYKWFIDNDLNIHFYIPKLNLGIVEEINGNYPLSNLNINSKVGDFRTKEILSGEDSIVSTTIKFEEANKNRFKMPIFTQEVTKIVRFTVKSSGSSTFFDEEIINVSEIGNDNDYKNVTNQGAHYQYYYLNDSNEIHINKVLDNQDYLIVYYDAKIPVQVSLTDHIAIDRVKNRMGGSGKVEFAHQEQNIKSQNAAMIYASNQLDAYSEFQGNVTFDVYTYTEDFYNNTENVNNGLYPSMPAPGFPNEVVYGDSLYDSYGPSGALMNNLSITTLLPINWKVGDIIRVSNNPLIKTGDYVISALTHTISSSFHITTNVTMTDNDIYDEYQQYWKEQSDQSNSIDGTTQINSYDEVLFCLEIVKTFIAKDESLLYPSLTGSSFPNELNGGDSLYNQYGPGNILFTNQEVKETN